MDVADLARINPECPPLLSKKMMAKWKVLIDFRDQQVNVKKHGLVKNFIKESPLLDLFELGDPRRIRQEPGTERILARSITDS